MINQTLVHEFSPLQLLQLLYQGIIAKDGTGQTKGISCGTGIRIIYQKLGVLINKINN
jgi:hypothetical protein